MADSLDPATGQLHVREYYAPVMLGTVLGTFLYGVDLNQFITYLSYRKHDPWSTQSLVAFLFVMSTVQECMSIYSVWFFSVQNFGNYQALTIQSWANTAPIGIIMALISVSVQQYFLWRVRIFSRSWILFGVLSLCSIAASGIALVNTSTTLVALTNKSRAESLISLDARIAMIQTTIGLNVFVNVMIAGLLLYYLLKHRTGFKRTDTIIRRLVLTCVHSPLLNALISFIDIIVFKTTFPANWFLIAAIPLGQVYTMSILAMLNSRANLRDAWNGVTDIDVDQLPQDRHIRFNRNITLSKQNEPVRVGVTVERHAQVAVDPFAARVKDGRGRRAAKRAKAGEANTGMASVESTEKSERDEHEMEEFTLAVHALSQIDAEDEKTAAVA